MKVFIKILGGILALLVIAAAIAAIMLAQFDPNDHKARIESAISEAAGRSFQITGPIKATYFPVLGFDIAGIRMGQPQGFSSGDFLSVKNAQAGVKVAPLFHKKIEITKVTLNEPAINIIKQANGNTNLSFPAHKKSEATAQTSSGDGTAMDLSVEQVEIDNARLHYEDKKTGQTWSAESVNVTLPGFKPGDSTPIKADMTVKGGDNMEITLRASGTMQATPDAGTFALQGMKADIGMNAPALAQPVNVTLHGDLMLDQKAEKLSAENINIAWQGTDIQSSLSVNGFAKPHVNFNASADTIDIDALTAAFSGKNGKTTANKAKSASSKSGGDGDILPFDLLRTLTLDGAVKVGVLKMAELEAQNLSATITAANRVLKIAPVTAGFYDGTLNGTVTIDVRGDTPAMAVNSDLENLQVGKLLQAKMGQDYLSGQAAFALDIKSAGRSVNALRRGAGGTLAFDFGEGYINKWQLSKRINQAIAYFETGKLDENASDKIYFTSLDGKFMGQNGVFTNNDLVLLAPKSHALGSGTVNLAADRVDYSLRVGLGDDPEKLADTRHLPISITGPLAQPQYTIDVQGLIQEVAGEKIEKKKEELLNKAFEKLGGDKKKAGGEAAPADGTDTTGEETVPPKKEDPAKELLRGLMSGG